MTRRGAEPEARPIAGALVAWYQHSQRDLPWRRTRDPYAIWVSEIMCQQTRVATAIPYWQRWMARFPTVAALAAAPIDDVLASWAGLGYYARARNLHTGAAEVVARWGGQLPTTAAELRAIRGIGAYTAGAIASIAYAERVPLVDGNVARVLARLWALTDDVKSSVGQRRLWDLAGQLVTALPPGAAPGDLNQGLMELGALVCTPEAPRCDACPLRAACVGLAGGDPTRFPVLPARPGKDALPELRRVALWLTRGDQVLLARRRPDGLFGGLWELPAGDDAAAAARAIGGRLAALGPQLAVHEQVLSHRRLRVEAHAARLGRGRLGKLGDSGYDAVAWTPVSAATTLGVARATRTLLHRLAGKDVPWSSTPRPSPSSKRATRRSSPASDASATTPPTRTSPTPRRGRPRASTSSSTTRRR